MSKNIKQTVTEWDRINRLIEKNRVETVEDAGNKISSIKNKLLDLCDDTKEFATKKINEGITK